MLGPKLEELTNETPLPTPTLRLGPPSLSGAPLSGCEEDPMLLATPQNNPLLGSNFQLHPLFALGTSNQDIDSKISEAEVREPSLSTRSTMRAPLGALLATPVYSEFRPELQGGHGLHSDGSLPSPNQLRAIRPFLSQLPESPSNDLVLSPLPGANLNEAREQRSQQTQPVNGERSNASYMVNSPVQIHQGSLPDQQGHSSRGYCSLSCASWVFVLMQVVIWAAWGIMSNSKTALVYPVLLSPCIPVAILWWRNRVLLPIDDVVLAFAQGFSPAGVMIFCCQLMLCLIAIAIYSFLFFDNDQFILYRPVGSLIPLYLVVSFGVFSLLEEVSKYRIIMHSEARYTSRGQGGAESTPSANNNENPWQEHESRSSSDHPAQVSHGSHITVGKERLIIMTAMTSGFTTGLIVFAVIFYSLLYDSAIEVVSRGAIASGASEREAEKVTTLLSLTFALTALSTPSQLLSGYLLSLRIVLRDYYRHTEFASVWKVIRYPAFLRGLGYFQSALCFSGLFGPVNSVRYWLALTIPALLIFGELWRKTRNTERELPPEYLRRVGSLTESYSLLQEDADVGSPMSQVGSEPSQAALGPSRALASAPRAHQDIEIPMQTLGERAVPSRGAAGHPTTEAKSAPASDGIHSLLNDDDVWNGSLDGIPDPTLESKRNRVSKSNGKSKKSSPGRKKMNPVLTDDVL